MNEQDWQEMWNHLIHIFTTHHKPQQLEVLFTNLLPPAERQILAKRLMVGALHLAGWPAKDIAKSLRLSKATVYKFIALLESATDYQTMLQPIADRIKMSERDTAEDETKEEGGSIWGKLW